MTESKKTKPDPELPPLEQELADAASAEPNQRPPASPDEIESGSLFGTEAGEELAAQAAEGGVEAKPAELAELRAQADEYLDGWQRARAEFANYKKRIEREQEEARQRTTAAVISKLLPVVDDLRLALRDRPDDAETGAWADGVELIQRKLTALLEAEGVEPIPAEGEMFDPALHEAVTHEASPEHREGQIIEVIQSGYRIGERVLRPARVRVAR